MKILPILIAAVLFVIFEKQPVFALPNGGLNAADLLNIVPDAETVSMGGNAIALTSNRPSASNNNPAALSGIDQDMFSFCEAAYPAGLYYTYAGIGMPSSYGGNIAFSFGIMNYTGVDTYNADFTPANVSQSYDAVVGVGYAFKIEQNTPVYNEIGSVGITAKFLESNLAYYDSETLVIDAGCIYRYPFCRWNYGWALVKELRADMNIY